MTRTKQRPVHIAIALDVDPRSVARWMERDGQISPNGSNARRLARHFGHPEDYFLTTGFDDPVAA